ncbi:hypothetical protein MHB84_26985 [Paenibacillus sp. FSL F4-0087]|uniref:hypothetical protein n=1 Tax=Paenibacillus sp. FSL F4-0087 TaxID=2921368 RepID=UPI00097007F6|nr:hypothetical protein BK122_24550 [Paenibacillus pabuli]
MFREFSHEDLVIFELKAEDYNYDHIIQAIDYICPDEYSEVEITSYYECLNFTKDQIEVNFSYVFGSPELYQFELFPYGSHSVEHLSQLRVWLQVMEQYITQIK